MVTRAFPINGGTLPLVAAAPRTSDLSAKRGARYVSGRFAPHFGTAIVADVVPVGRSPEFGRRSITRPALSPFTKSQALSFDDLELKDPMSNV
jgi:hypothetical protein